jgi:4-deoxy-L-threo-5-hexosulose-uronate ketol-isomerase
MAVDYEIRFAAHPEDFKTYDTGKIRKDFLIHDIMTPGKIKMVYSHYDRMIIGGAVPADLPLLLETIDPLKSDYFLQRREIGIINVGNTGIVEVDGESFQLDAREGIYVGRENKSVLFKSVDEKNPPHFYFNSAPAHKKFPARKVGLPDAIVVETGALETSNARRINKLLVHGVIESCQVQMGLTELKTGSVWNTMPMHVHSRRMEAYFYFNVPEDQVICHYMGEPHETRHIWLSNEQAVISPPWSVHSAAGTCSYSFIWGMAGENLDYSDMDWAKLEELR